MALLVAGCNGDDPNQRSKRDDDDARRAAATEQPRSQPAQPPAELDPILPESREWSREVALQKLGEVGACVSAAVRLVRLSDTAVHCVPDPLPPRLAARLAVEKVGETTWVIGIRDRQHQNLLRSPALIDEEGEVHLLAEGAEEEVSTLHLSVEPLRFPHLLLTPERVVVVNDNPQVALKLSRQPSGLRFEVREINNVNYVLLMISNEAVASRPVGPDAGGAMEESPADHAGAPDAPAPGAAAGAPGEPAGPKRFRDATGLEVARYRWDVYENSFAGPAADKLPDPPGGRFEMDLEASEALLPVGGELPPPMKNTEPPIPASQPGRPPF